MQNGVLQGVLIPAGSILTSVGTVDLSNRRIPMTREGKRIEVFTEDLRNYATRVEALTSLL